jgi:pullulanase
MGREIWLIGNDPRIYTERPDISPRVAIAALDSPRDITVRTSHRMTPEIARNPANFSVKGPGGHEPRIARVDMIDPFAVRLTLADPIEGSPEGYEVAVVGFKAGPVSPRGILDDASRYHTSAPMGAVYTPAATAFRIFAPTASAASVLLFDAATARQPKREIPMTRNANGTWETVLQGDWEGAYYRLKVNSLKHGERIENDPWATNTTGDDGNARITDLRRHDPPGFRPIRRPAYGTSPTDAIIWEIHIRDFTIQPEGGVSAPNRGKYLGFIEPNTAITVNGRRYSTGIDYLKELGVTHVQILPPQDFDNNEVNPEYSWGYMTAFFNSPEGWFASEIRGPQRVAEFKRMVQGLHDAGIGVIMDVVYNHTGTQNTFEAISPRYFHRMRPDGSFFNGSGTGNEFRSEAPMARQFILDSCRFWVEEYGIDGFRFDLMGLIDMDTMRLLREELLAIHPHLLVYGEPWAATGLDGSGLDRFTDKNYVRGTGLGAFNDHFRNALKGSPDGPDPGYVQNGSQRDAVKVGIRGSISDWAAHPTETVNYVTCHDNLTLTDKIKKTNPGLSPAEQMAIVRLTHGILAVSQGMMFIHGGAEFGYTKGGNHNSYNAGDAVNQIDWKLRAVNAASVDYMAGLIEFRRANPVLRLRTAEEVIRRLHFRDAWSLHGQSIAFHLDGRGLEGQQLQDIVVLINPAPQEATFTIPATGGMWSVYIDADRAGTTTLRQHQGGTTTVAPRSMMVLGR